MAEEGWQELLRAVHVLVGGRIGRYNEPAVWLVLQELRAGGSGNADAYDVAKKRDETTKKLLTASGFSGDGPTRATRDILRSLLASKAARDTLVGFKDNVPSWDDVTRALPSAVCGMPGAQAVRGGTGQPASVGEVAARCAGYHLMEPAQHQCSAPHQSVATTRPCTVPRRLKDFLATGGKV